MRLLSVSFIVALMLFSIISTKHLLRKSEVEIEEEEVSMDLSQEAGVKNVTKNNNVEKPNNNQNKTLIEKEKKIFKLLDSFSQEIDEFSTDIFNKFLNISKRNMTSEDFLEVIKRIHEGGDEFISVEESTVTLGHIFQLGCFKACSTVIFSSSSTGK